MSSPPVAPCKAYRFLQRARICFGYFPRFFAPICRDSALGGERRLPEEKPLRQFKSSSFAPDLPASYDLTMMNANPSGSSDFLLTNDAARYLDVSPQTIRVWERTGRLPAVKTERGVRLF